MVRTVAARPLKYPKPVGAFGCASTKGFQCRTEKNRRLTATEAAAIAEWAPLRQASGVDQRRKLSEIRRGEFQKKPGPLSACSPAFGPRCPAFVGSAGHPREVL